MVMTAKAQAILEQEKECIRIAQERLAQVECGEVEMLSWDNFRSRVDDLIK